MIFGESKDGGQTESRLWLLLCRKIKGLGRSAKQKESRGSGCGEKCGADARYGYEKSLGKLLPAKASVAETVGFEFSLHEIVAHYGVVWNRSSSTENACFRLSKYHSIPPKKTAIVVSVVVKIVVDCVSRLLQHYTHRQTFTAQRKTEQGTAAGTGTTVANCPRFTPGQRSG